MQPNLLILVYLVTRFAKVAIGEFTVGILVDVVDSSAEGLKLMLRYVQVRILRFDQGNLWCAVSVDRVVENDKISS